MAVQNLVSATISSETKDEILGQLASIRGKLDFLLNLQADEASAILKAGKEFLPFIDGCYSVSKTHSEILSGVFNKAEYERDHHLSQDLGEIADARALPSTDETLPTGLREVRDRGYRRYGL